MGDFECESDEATESLRDEQRTTVPGSVGKAAERGTVATDQAMGERRRRRVVPMCDMRNRVQREGNQQRRESNSQPLW